MIPLIEETTVQIIGGKPGVVVQYRLLRDVLKQDISSRGLRNPEV